MAEVQDPAHAERPNRRLMSTVEAAAYIHFSRQTLTQMRCTGDGPQFLKLSHKRVVYDQGDLDAWLDSRRRRSTSEVA
jgi:predicted DNA-binding transcriptional regulator AlpA